MNRNTQSNKLVEKGNNNNNNNTKKKWIELYSKVIAEAKTCDKFRNKLDKMNKGLDKDKQIPQYKAVSEALKLWMEKHNV